MRCCLRIVACLAAILGVTYVQGADQYVRGCYYTNWAQYRPDPWKFKPDDYIPGLCTHIFYAFVVMTPNFELRAFEWNDESTDWSKGYYQKVLDLKQKQPDLKVLLSFGGWTFSEANLGLLSSMAASPANRAAFINSVLTFVRRIGFDGFDLDWEYPSGNDKANFAILIREMRAAFEKEAQASGKPRLLLTAAVAAGVWRINDGYDGQSLGRDFDYINIMTYDFHGGWEQKTGFNSPLYDRDNDQLAIANAALEWVKIGVPKSKLLVGLGTYGRGWQLTNANNNGINAPTSGTSPRLTYTRENGWASYYEICELIEQRGYKEIYDEQQQSPYIIGGEGNRVWIGYDNVKSFDVKLDWIKQNGFAGAFIWALDLDDFRGQCRSSNGQRYPLLSAINAKLGGSVPPPQPYPQPQPQPHPQPQPQPQPHPQPQPQPFPQPQPQPQPSGGACSNGDGIYPDPTSCDSYLFCNHGKPIKMVCPTGTQFNEVTMACDWPQNVRCNRG